MATPCGLNLSDRTDSARRPGARMQAMPGGRNATQPNCGEV